MTELVLTDSTNTIVVSTIEPTGSVVTTIEEPTIIIAGVVGPKGEPGTPGESTIGGSSVSISNLASGDILLYSGSAWNNIPQENLTDAGNF